MMKILLIIPILFLGGCELMLSNLIQDYQDSRDITRGYIGETVDDRKWVRQKCRENLNNDVDDLRAEDKGAEARQLLRESYPPAIAEDDATPLDLNTPHICGKGE